MTAPRLTITTGRTELVDQAEIARRLDVSREWVRRLSNDGVLPEELGTLGGRKVWRWAPVRAWALREGRLRVMPRAGSLYTRRGGRAGLCDACEAVVVPATLLDHHGKPEAVAGTWSHLRDVDALACKAIDPRPADPSEVPA